MRTPSASSRSAEPDFDVLERLPCLATAQPAPAAISAAVVEMLKVEGPPPVPAVSTSPLRVDLDRGGEAAHRPRQADELRDRLALSSERDQEGGRSDVIGAALHDLGEDDRGVIGGQMLAVADRVDRPGDDVVRHRRRQARGRVHLENRSELRGGQGRSWATRRVAKPPGGVLAHPRHRRRHRLRHVGRLRQAGLRSARAARIGAASAPKQDQRAEAIAEEERRPSAIRSATSSNARSTAASADAASSGRRVEDAGCVKLQPRRAEWGQAALPARQRLAAEPERDLGFRTLA